MNTLSQQRRVIITSALIVGSVGIAAGIERGDEIPSARFLIGCGVAYTICSAMVDLGSPMGAGFAVLIMISAIFYQGEDAFKLLRKRQAKEETIRPFNKHTKVKPLKHPTKGQVRAGNALDSYYDQLERLQNG